MKNQLSQFKSKVLSLLLILILTIGVSSPLATAMAVSVNLISNPDLETVNSTDPTLPDQWTIGGYGTNDRTLQYPVVGMDGGSAARVDITTSTDGDVKWVFNNVPIRAGQSYLFENNYMATVPTQFAIQYTNDSGAVSYDPNFLSIPASPDTWGKASVKFTPSAGVVAGTVFHLLNSPGSLTVDNYSLKTIPPPAPFDHGFVSLTFDDGTQSQMDNTTPILDSAGIKATFYIVTHASAGFIVPTSTPESVLADTIYIYKDLYTSNGESEISAQVTLTDNTVVNAEVVDNAGMGLGSSATLPASPSTNTQAEVSFYIPPTAKSVVVSHSTITDDSLVISNASFGAKNYMPIQDIMSLKANGHEVGAHTQTHPDLTTLSTADAQIQILGSRNELLAGGLPPVLAFNHPYGNNNPSTVEIIKNAGFTSARTVMSGFNGKDTSPFDLTAQSVNANTTLDQVKEWIDNAVINKTWLVLVFHDIIPNTDNDPYASTPAMLQDIVDYLQTNNVPVHTVSQGIGLMNGITPTPTPPVTSPAATTKTISLNSGWNLISLPVSPINTTTGQAINYTAETFGQLAGADVVSQWVASDQQYISHVVGVSTNNFDITPGMGFFIHVTSAKNLSITGNVIAQSVPVLTTGWNLVGWSNNVNTTAEALGTSIANANVIAMYNATTQQWVSHVMNLPINNFTITPGDAVFIHKL